MSPSENWSEPPRAPELEDGEVHLWRAFLDSEQISLREFEAVLADDERERASRFVFPRDRDRFIRGRGILRAILGQYTQRPAAAVQFVYDPQGKPRLRLGESDPPIRFNLAHSQGLAVYAFSRGREIGTDVEALRSDVPGEGVAEQFFSSRELAEFRCLPPELRVEGFFLCWTRKEAYLKALGTGLTVPTGAFDVSLTPGMPETLQSADGSRWTLRSFRPGDGYAGAVVAEGRDWGLRLWDWTSASQ
ncbi:MAG: hypothetical protein A3H97_09740 [Acidobacteria bacterium RIFCSPLOWO2_02_FULL_65_29]|nr:MAG: hypothetical protein A3H97_09740 [Acidobacteria bacterium RIFCSPLOWO2_02_FULL_65_29]